MSEAPDGYVCQVCDLFHPEEHFHEPNAHVCDECKDDGADIPEPSPYYENLLRQKAQHGKRLEIMQSELASRMLSRRRFLHYVQRFKPNYTAGWVHRDIARRLERFMQDVADKKSPRLLLCMPPRHGKALALDTPVPTPSGWTTMGALRAGDEVFDETGSVCRVSAVSPVWRNRKVYEVRTDMGDTVVADEEHEWVVRLCRKRPVFKAKTTKWLATRKSDRKPRLNDSEALHLPEKELPIDPYVLGVWLGDGRTQSSAMCSADQFILDEIGRIEGGYNTYASAGRTVHFRAGPHYREDATKAETLQGRLRDIGLLGNKHVPMSYLRASARQRLALLQGLIDTDGYVAPDGQIEFCSTLRVLAEDCRELVNSLGVKASLSEGRSTLNGVDCGPKYRVVFYMRDAARLPRKAALTRDGERQPGTYLSFEEAGVADTVCIEVDSPSHQFLVGKTMIPTHNSELTSRNFPSWILGHHPEWEIIAASHTQSLAMSFSRHNRDRLRDPAYQAIFPDSVLDPDSQSTENWMTTGGGGYMAAGVGTGITGRGCFVSDTLIHSEYGLIEIERLVQLHKSGVGVRVLAYNHGENRTEYRHVIAAFEKDAEELVRVEFDGKQVTCTPNHPIFSREYWAAEVLERGDEIIVAEDMPCLSEGEECGIQGVPCVLREYSTPDSRTYLFKLQKGIHPSAVRSSEIGETGSQRPLLLEGVFGNASRVEERETLPDVRKPCLVERWFEKREVLFPGLSDSSSPGETSKTLPSVFEAVRRSKHILLQAVRGLGTLAKNAWRRKFELQGRFGVPNPVFQTSSVDTATGQKAVRGMFEQGRLADTSCGPRQAQRHPDKSGHVVSGVPHHPSQVSEGRVSLVERVRGEPVRVYDIQVEGLSNYFAGSLLVHNCHIGIIDDPVKDMEAADSDTIRENTWEWYLSTFYTRLAPGAGVLGILTLWNEDDWGGRIIQQNGMEDGEKFEIVRYPATNEGYDEYLDGDDIIKVYPGQTAPDTATLTRLANSALHPERYDIDYLNKLKKSYYATGKQRIWHALYQQAPAPEDGLFFTKDMIKYGDYEKRTAYNVYQAWDFAITENQHSDWTSCTTLWQMPDGHLIVADVTRFKSNDGIAIVERMLDQYAIHRPNFLGVEDGQIWKSLKALFTLRCQERQLYPAYDILVPLTDKFVRAGPLKGLMQSGRVSIQSGKSWTKDFVDELLKFGAAKHDDQVDSTSWAVRVAIQHQPKRAEAPKKIASWKEKLRGMGHADGGHMSA